MSALIISYDYVNSLLRYEPDTGKLFWRVRRGGSANAGAEAGALRKGYMDVCINGKYYGGHRVCWLLYYGAWPVNDIDHWDGVKLNNRISNLCPATHAENMKNLPKRKDNASGVVGISWHRGGCKWEVYISIDKKRCYLGLYADFLEACCVRKAAELKHGYHVNHGRQA